MPSDKDKSDESKKPDDGGAAPPAEAILAERQLDPDQATFAEQAIRRFVSERLDEWYGQVESSVDQLEGWLRGQDEQSREVFAQRGFLDAIGDRFVDDLYQLAGGRGAPIMDALASGTDETVSWAQHAESDVGGFLVQVRRGVRDACWFVRDALPSVVSQGWPQLLDLAYEGSTDFIPALHAMGLPPFAFNPQSFADRLIGYSDAYRKSLAPQKEQATEQLAGDANTQAAADEAKKMAQDDDVKKQTLGAVTL